MKSINKWKNDDVIEFLNVSNMSELCDIFKIHKINGKDLLDLNSQELRDDLKIANLHLRKKLLRKIKNLKSETPFLVKVLYFSKEAIFKVLNSENFTLRDLLFDCIQTFNIVSSVFFHDN